MIQRKQQALTQASVLMMHLTSSHYNSDAHAEDFYINSSGIGNITKNTTIPNYLSGRA
jgi:hypothetical protein